MPWAGRGRRVGCKAHWGDQAQNGGTYMRMWGIYSLFLAFPITCEQTIIEKVCYLCSWCMGYGMMKGTLLLLQSTWEILLQKFKINSLSPRWCWIFYQGHMLLLETFHISCLFCVEFCQDSLTLVERFIMLPRSRSHTRYICVLLLHWKYAKTCFSSTSKCSAPTLGEDKNMFARIRINAPSS